MYVGAGPDGVSLDAYRLSGPLDKTERLTYSPVGLGMNGLGANQHAPTDFLGRLRRRPWDRPGPS